MDYGFMWGTHLYDVAGALFTSIIAAVKFWRTLSNRSGKFGGKGLVGAYWFDGHDVDLWRFYSCGQKLFAHHCRDQQNNFHWADTPFW
jgi:hypothetical protein